MSFSKSLFLTLILVSLTLALAGCEQDTKPDEQKLETEAKAEVIDKAISRKQADVEKVHPGVIDVTTTDFRIEAPSEIKKGWTTFRFSNEGKQVHFVAMYRLVDGKTIDDQLTEVAPVFDPLMEGLRSGELTKADIGPFFAENVPEWGLQMTWVGGAGLLAPGNTTQSSFYIDQAGTYLLECYVKAPDGQWHTLMGMLQQVNVTDEMNEANEPSANYEVTVSNAGVEAPETVPAGKHTFRVIMQEDPQGFMPYDLNLARIDDSTDMDKLAFWMDWTNVGGLRAPAPVEFLGGLEHMRATNHGYVTVDLTPGKYVWISEINAANTQKTFTVE